ncbi:MAG: nascent polypeptide-associated complex protein [Candidatus Thermoplasmatota archaeon]
MMPGMDPRQMAMMMKRMGVEMADIDGVEEVLVRTKTVEYRFRKASVSVVRAQGSETWQIQGKPEKTPRGAETATSAAVPPTTAPQPPAPTPISADDVRLVMEQTGRSNAEARAALEATNGDLAEAIVRLGTR